MSFREANSPIPPKKGPYKNQPQLWPNWKRFLQYSCFAICFCRKKSYPKARLVFRKGCRFAAVKGANFLNLHSQLGGGFNYVLFSPLPSIWGRFPI